MNWCELYQASLDAILAWGETQEWAGEMAGCAQDAEWHAEGDVWTHTKMVCRELERLDCWSNLSRDDQVRLIFTAVFHDSGKPATSQFDPESGRIRSPKHAIHGEHLARAVLRQIDCPLAMREEICRLVRFHGRPAFLLDKPEPTHELARLSWLVSNRLLYLFALADTRGRRTTETSRAEENLHYWKLTAEELQCLDEPYAFATEHARFTFARQASPNLHYVPYDDFCCNVTMVCGLPGAGKDTWLKRFRANTPVVALDEVRRAMKIAPTDDQGEVVQRAMDLCREFLRRKESFAFNATNVLRQTRARWIHLFADYGARIELVYVEPPLNRILAQNQCREHSVPQSVLRKLSAKLEPPTWLEGHSLVLCDGEAVTEV